MLTTGFVLPFTLTRTFLLIILENKINNLESIIKETEHKTDKQSFQEC